MKTSISLFQNVYTSADAGFDSFAGIDAVLCELISRSKRDPKLPTLRRNRYRGDKLKVELHAVRFNFNDAV